MNQVYFFLDSCERGFLNTCCTGSSVILPFIIRWPDHSSPHAAWLQQLLNEPRAPRPFYSSVWWHVTSPWQPNSLREARGLALYSQLCCVHLHLATSCLDFRQSKVTYSRIKWGQGRDRETTTIQALYRACSASWEEMDWASATDLQNLDWGRRWIFL